MRFPAALACLAALIASPATAQQAPAAPTSADNPGDGRIIGGTPVKKGKAPWMVEIFFIDSIPAKILAEDAAEEAAHSAQSDLLKDRPAYDINHECGAVLIARNWVLTAGHCIQDVSQTAPVADLVPMFMKYMRLRLGSLTIKGKSGSVCRPRQVVLADPGAGDIALIRIDQKACTPRPKPGSVAPIRIAGLSSDDLLLTDYSLNTSFTVYGWGMTKPRAINAKSVVTSASPHDVTARYLDPVAPSLQMAGPIFFVPHDRCLATPGYRAIVTDTMVCAGVQNGAMDQCTGDSGGPLVLDNKVGPGAKSVPLLIGLVHGGRGCGLAMTPGVYVYVPRFLDWIETTIGNGDARAGKTLLVQPQRGT